MNSLFSIKYAFERYSLEHYAILFFFLLLGIYLIRASKNWELTKQRKLVLYFSIGISVFQLLKIPIRYFEGTFDSTADLPFHLCNFLPFVFVYIFYTRSRKLWAIIFFWVILACSQANFTPVVKEGLFHWEALRYWFNHGILVILALYPAFRWKWNLIPKDILHSILGINIVAIFIGAINLILDSNYMYLMHKPPGTTLYSLMPEWPFYILILEAILLVWSVILFWIFKVLTKRNR